MYYHVFVSAAFFPLDFRTVRAVRYIIFFHFIGIDSFTFLLLFYLVFIFVLFPFLCLSIFIVYYTYSINS